MTPPRAVDNMGPSDRPRDIHSDDDENYERDGWRIGFDVAYNGVGMSTTADFEDDFVVIRPDSDDSSSEAETDPDSDAEPERSRDGAPDGYVALRAIVEDPNPGEEDADKEQEEEENTVTEREEQSVQMPSVNFSHSFVSPGIQKDFEQALKEAEAVYSNHPNPEIPKSSSPRKSIDLDKNKISEIRSAMANVSIPEPQWAKDLGDAKVLELLEKLKKKDKE
ncbi:hypothetical protein QR680_006027 [Steinernema hermaphroditum]|uniref:Male-enhanced antigen 1 n=1 Tax=Steinernema hermaphroditum TaxID=289476 RepID=A0AA39LWP4_9BILA|nr:hypothetical protein QR680_006027 [Steinernema hermaphroditum]